MKEYKRKEMAAMKANERKGKLEESQNTDASSCIEEAPVSENNEYSY